MRINNDCITSYVNSYFPNISYLLISITLITGFTSNNLVAQTCSDLSDVPAPVIHLSSVEDYEPGGQWFTRYRIPVTNWEDFPSVLFTPSPDLPPCGTNTSAQRTWVEI